MSSSYSLSKQSFKEKLGRSHITLDEQFNISWGNIQQLEGVVDRVRTHMTGYIDAMKALCVSGHAVSDDFKSFYERQPDRLTTISIRYEMIQNGFRTDKIALLERLVNQNVFLRMEELKVELASLRQKVGDREVARKRYDHYLSKITELRDAHSRAKAKGKEKSADLEKLTRNEKKFEDARLEYVAVNHIVTKALWTAWSKRYAIMDPIYAEILKIKTNFTQALANQLQTVIQPLKAQMMIELKEEALPAVFGGGSNQQNGHTGDGDDVHGILSPGGTTEIDSRRLAATIQVANEKLEADARVAATREHEKLTRKATKSGHSAPDMNMGPLDAEEAIGQDVEATVVAPTAAARKTKVLKHPKHAESEESSDSESSEDEEAARRRRKKEKERKKREKEKAAAAAAGLAAPASVAASSSSSTNLDFLADVVSQPQSKPSKKPPIATQSIDLLAFSPMKPPQQEQPQQAQQPFAGNALWDSFSPPPTSTVPASNGPSKGKKNLLELDSFFGSSGALMPPPESQSSAPKAVDPFFDLPSVDQPAAPVDLFAIQPTQSQPQPLIPSSLSRSQSIQPGSTTDPFFAAPSASSNSTMTTAKPAPTIAAPGGPAHTSSRSKVTKKSKKADDSESSDSSSDVSSDSDSDQEEGRPTPKRTNKTPSSAAVPSSMPLAVAASAAPLNTSDPFDFDANPTPSQRDAMQHSASGRSTHAANKSATAASNHVQSPKKNTAAPPPPLSAPAPAVARGQTKERHIQRLATN